MYYGIYHAATTGQTGCVKEFATVAQPTIVFAPQVNYYCDLCTTTHPFRYVRAITVATPSQTRTFETYCTERHIERDVEVH